MKSTTIGLDIAKNVFQAHGVDAKGNVVLRKVLKRWQVLEFFANRAPSLIGMEACAGAHYWARELGKQRHEVKLVLYLIKAGLLPVRFISPQFVKPYVKGNKNDANDAEAICEAVGRPNMRFVPAKTPEQQELLALHRVRSGLVKERTAQANQLRGLLGEYGIVIGKGLAQLRKRLPEILEDAENDLSDLVRALFADLHGRILALDQQVAAYGARLKVLNEGNEVCRMIGRVPGVGPITATAMAASLGDGQAFETGRQVSAWLGLVPGQDSSGGKPKLLGIKRGDTYLRTLLIHGARAVVRAAAKKHDVQSRWINALVQRRNANIAAVALANKNARVIWALLRRGENYRAPVVANA
jgi:transposase